MCEVCGAYAEVIHTDMMTGVDFDGSDAIFIVERIECVNEHRYHRVNEERTVKL